MIKLIAFDELKSIAGTLQEAGKIEQYRQILDAQRDLLDMQKKIKTLEDEVIELKAKLKVKGDLTYENNSYWLISGEHKDGPYCSHCWDKNNDLIRMHPMTNTDYARCPECDESVLTNPNADTRLGGIHTGGVDWEI